MDLSVITVTWNSASLIDRQSKSVQAGCQDISCEQIVVDNNSSDATAALIREQFPEVKLIVNAENRGFAAANNQGAAIAQGEFFLFLNPDMRVEEGSLDKMVAWMKARPNVGIASCKLVDEQGRLNEDAKPRRFPGLLDQLALILKIPHFFPSVLNHYLFKDFNPDIEQEVDSVRGSFFLMRRELCQKLGWAFDPRYFIWFEEVDACREAKRLGYKVMYTPKISCVDYIGQSFKQRPTLWKQKQFTKSMLTYFKKWEPWYVWIWIALARPVGIFAALCAQHYKYFFRLAVVIPFFIFFSLLIPKDISISNDGLFILGAALFLIYEITFFEKNFKNFIIVIAAIITFVASVAAGFNERETFFIITGFENHRVDDKYQINLALRPTGTKIVPNFRIDISAPQNIPLSTLEIKGPNLPNYIGVDDSRLPHSRSIQIHNLIPQDLIISFFAPENVEGKLQIGLRPKKL